MAGESRDLMSHYRKFSIGPGLAVSEVETRRPAATPMALVREDGVALESDRWPGGIHTLGRWDAICFVQSLGRQFSGIPPFLRKGRNFSRSLFSLRNPKLQVLVMTCSWP